MRPSKVETKRMYKYLVIDNKRCCQFFNESCYFFARKGKMYKKDEHASRVHLTREKGFLAIY